MKTYEPNPVVDDFHARRPVDKKAALVTGRGSSYTHLTSGQHALEWKVPPVGEMPYPGVPDLRGRKFGRFTVMYFFRTHRKKKSKRQLWIVRCTCGVYSYRSSNAIQNPANNADACVQCSHLIYLRRNERFRNTGAELDAKELI